MALTEQQSIVTKKNLMLAHAASNDNIRPLKARINNELLPLLEYSHNDAKVCLPTTKCVLFIKLKDISYFKANDMYCKMHDVYGNTHFITKSIKWIEDRLNFSIFYRVHKSYFINLYNIAQYTRRDGGSLVMECGDEVPVSRRKRGEIGEVLGL